MSARVVSHAERLRKRHERASALRAVPPLAGEPDPSGAKRSGSEGGDASAADIANTPLAIVDGGPPASGGTGRADEDDDATRPNPFAGFMGCAP